MKHSKLVSQIVGVFTMALISVAIVACSQPSRPKKSDAPAARASGQRQGQRSGERLQEGTGSSGPRGPRREVERTGEESDIVIEGMDLGSAITTFITGDAGAPAGPTPVIAQADVPQAQQGAGNNHGPNTGAFVGTDDEDNRRSFIDIANDNVLALMRNEITKEAPGSPMRTESEKLAASIKRIFVTTQNNNNVAQVLISFSDDSGGMIRFDLRGTLSSGVAQLQQYWTTHPQYVFSAVLSCLDATCNNTVTHLHQWQDSDNDGSYELCKRVYFVYRHGDASMTLDPESITRYRSNRDMTEASRSVLRFFVNTLDRATGANTWAFPYAAQLKMRTWAVAFGPSEFLVSAREALTEEEAHHERTGKLLENKTLAFRGYMYDRIDARAGGAGVAPVEVGHIDSPRFLNGLQLVAGPATYAFQISHATQMYNSNAGRITIDLQYKGEHGRSLVEFQSQIPRLEAMRSLPTPVVTNPSQPTMRAN